MVANEKWFGASAGFYPETIDQSVRFNDGDSPYLSRTFGTPTSTTQGTWSCWFKRGDINARGMLWSGSNYEFIDISTDGQIIVPYLSNLGYVYTNGRFRDPTSWYNLVVTFDTPNATEADRLRIYVNGVRQEVYDSITLTQNATFQRWNVSGVTGTIGNFGYNNTIYFDGLLAECNWIDGTALEPSSFGETKSGVWIPKEISGLTYGNNGFRLTFADSSSLGDDTSGNGNDFTSSGLASSDVVLDSPTNNFATLNNLIRPYEVTPAETVSDGNLNAYFNSSGVSGSYWSTFFLTSGKWYFEVNVIAIGGNADVGISNKPSNAGRGTYTSDARGNGYFYQKDGQKGIDNTFSSYGDTYTTGDIIGCAFDLDNNTITFYKNNSSQGQITGVTTTEDGYIPAIEGFNGTRLIANFGQDSSFAGNETAQGNKDANNQGDFYYAPPSGGYLALCSANLPDTTISPNQDTQATDHMGTAIWSGNGTARKISLGFEADWVWTKMRSHANAHYAFDSSRGDDKGLYPNLTQQEGTSSSSVSFGDSDGFDLGTNAQVNGSGYTFVGWSWRCGGSAPTKTYKVVVVSDSGNKYRFRNSADSATFAQSAVTLDLQEGGTYIFDWSDSTAQGHPIRFSLTSDGTHGGGSEYTTGVVKDDSAYKTTITVASGVATLYYYCANHSGMGGQVNTNTTHGSTNFDGSLLSVSQTNETAGFSIVTYTGTGSNATIGHGLGVAPSMVITKVRSTTNDWGVYHVGINDNTKALLLSSANGATAYGGATSMWNNTAPTSTVFSVGTNSSTGGSANFVAYCFAEISGFSRMGSYTGNGSTDGTFVYTGFRPAWVMLKATSASNWFIFDNKRNAFNVATTPLFSNSSSAEEGTLYPIDFISSGFKLRASSGLGTNESVTYIYMAFAEQPFKFSNAR